MLRSVKEAWDELSAFLQEHKIAIDSSQFEALKEVSQWKIPQIVDLQKLLGLLLQQAKPLDLAATPSNLPECKLLGEVWEVFCQTMAKTTGLPAERFADLQHDNGRWTLRQVQGLAVFLFAFLKEAAQPAKSAQPVKTAKSAQPVKTAKPAQSVKPAKPAKDVQPKPVKPAKPAQTAKPTQTAKPAQTVKVAQLEEPKTVVQTTAGMSVKPNGTKTPTPRPVEHMSPPVQSPRPSKYTTVEEALTAINTSRQRFYDILRTMLPNESREFQRISIGGLMAWFGLDLSRRTLLEGLDTSGHRFRLRLDDGCLVRRPDRDGINYAFEEQTLSLDEDPRKLRTIVQPHASISTVDMQFEQLLHTLNIHLKSALRV